MINIRVDHIMKINLVTIIKMKIMEITNNILTINIDKDTQAMNGIGLVLIS